MTKMTNSLPKMTNSLIIAASLLGVLFMSINQAEAAAFLKQDSGISTRQGYLNSRAGHIKPLQMIPDAFATSEFASGTFNNFNNLLVATIDSDIASVPDNEFAPIFAGGILVMFGGILSALIVGLILDSRDLYASVIADSYAQGAEDEDFWKGLSEEEKKKTQELLAKLKESKDGVPAPSMVKEAKDKLEGEETKKEESSKSETAPQTASGSKEKDAGMFSDY